MWNLGLDEEFLDAMLKTYTTYKKKWIKFSSSKLKTFALCVKDPVKRMKRQATEW